MWVPEADLEHAHEMHDAVQSVASIELSVLGNIALWTKSENPDLVENISTADVDVLGHQRA